MSGIPHTEEYDYMLDDYQEEQLTAASLAWNQYNGNPFKVETTKEEPITAIDLTNQQPIIDPMPEMDPDMMMGY